MSYYTERFSRLDYCQFLVSSQINYSLTYFAEHAKKWNHDTINRYLKGEKITPRLVWEKVQGQIEPSPKGYVIFDDTVLDKNRSREIEAARRQWSGNAGGVIRGIWRRNFCAVTCIYVNPETDQFWITDYRIYDPDADGKSKIDHLREMLTNVHYQKQLPFYAVLMDTWYASRQVIRHIERLEKVYYCPVKKNRLVDETDGAEPHDNVENLSWSKADKKRIRSMARPFT